MDTIIVSRHPATIEFIVRELGGECVYLEGRTCARPDGSREPALPSGVQTPSAWIPVLASATAEDVRGNVVIGNLPLHLAAEAAKVTAIEFAGNPPRGKEYSLPDMDAAGAYLRSYYVVPEWPAPGPDCFEIQDEELLDQMKNQDHGYCDRCGEHSFATTLNKLTGVRYCPSCYIPKGESLTERYVSTPSSAEIADTDLVERYVSPPK